MPNSIIAFFVVMSVVAVAGFVAIYYERRSLHQRKERCRMTCSKGSEGGTCPCTRPGDCDDRDLRGSCRQRVLKESRQFRKDLGRLLKNYNGRWVIYVDGRVQQAFDDEEEAYVSAVKRFGIRGGFVIAQVTPEAALPLVLR